MKSSLTPEDIARNDYTQNSKKAWMMLPLVVQYRLMNLCLNF